MTFSKLHDEYTKGYAIGYGEALDKVRSELLPRFVELCRTITESPDHLRAPMQALCLFTLLWDSTCYKRADGTYNEGPRKSSP